MTESRPLDGRTWVASSSDHLLASLHTLTVHAIGMRLEGGNTQRLRDAIAWKQVDSADNMGGAVTSALDSAGRMLVSIAPGSDFKSVAVTSRDLIDTSAGATQAFAVLARKVPGSRGLCNSEAGHALQPEMGSCVEQSFGNRPECCTTTAAAEGQEVSCALDDDFALVGGA